MDKIKYDSLYKFIVSIGIAIILLPFIFLSWILNNNEILMIKESELMQLTDTAQKVVEMEQNYKYSMLNNNFAIISISIIIWLIGIIIIIYGIVQWKNKVQKNEDKSIELSNKLLEKQIKDLTEEEKEEKVKEEIKEIEYTQAKDNSVVDNSSGKIRKYVEIQNYVYNTIKSLFKKYKVFEEVKIEKEQYDCVALSQEEYHEDYIFEIKYFSNINSIIVKLKEILLQMQKKEISYLKNTKRVSENVIIIIIDNITDRIMLEHKKLFDEIDSYNQNYRNNDKIIITDVKTLESELKRRFYRDIL